ncbi:EAL domain-containing protein [Thalassotalea marina]|uniref:Diguanylate cyclase n=1 Tax=Thalassotalea marina TaxID=1673741 RepID=A0A919EMQ0_9GAMM|nr:GGDEF domain-containing protein [Thalassotalea marina]GHG00908.1 diguanylate cyclase [Thalassotalea marina]
MYTFTQLVLRNIALAVCFNIAVMAIGSVFLSSNLAEKQTLFGQQLTTTVDNVDEQTLPQLSQLWLNSDTLSSLSITDSTSKAIVNQTSQLSALASLFAPTPTKISAPKSKLSINFQLNPTSSVNLMLVVFSVVLVLSLVLAIVSARVSISRYGNIVTQINQQIKIAFSDDSEITHQLAFDLPELEQGIKEIQSLLSGHLENTSTLENKAYVDPLTQIDNRTRFVQSFEAKDDNMEFGVLTITRCSELQTINQIHGYKEGDNYITQVANIIKNEISRIKGGAVFRLNSSDFACILPNVTIKAAETFADNLTNKFNDYQRASDLDSVGYTGLVAFTSDSPLGELLALADTGISVAQTKQKNAWYSQTDSSILESKSASYGNQSWRQEIDSVLENQRVTLLVQPIKPNSRNTKVYGEFLARFLNSSEEMLPTASFLAMAEKLDKIVEIDRMIIDKAFSLIKEKNLTDQQFGINISARSIHDEHFLIWLERRLLRDPAISSNLVFEITEYGLQQNIKTSKRFIDMVHRAGARITVERFGVGLTSFKFFRDLKPDFIKMDSTYTRDIDEDKNNQYFLRLMIDLAHRLSISVLAESVESQEEKFTLEKLFVDGCQGYYLGKPEKI